MKTKNFRLLSPHSQALVAMAVLLDGKEAEVYLGSDSHAGEDLMRAASELSEQPPELRMPFVGTLLREALQAEASLK